MKQLLLFVLALVFAPFAFAADVTQSLTITNGGSAVFSSTMTFSGMTDQDVAKLDARGNNFLNLVKAQGKMSKAKGPYSMTFKSTTGQDVMFDALTFGDVNKILRANLKYLTDSVVDSEARDKAGKGKPWGN